MTPCQLLVRKNETALMQVIRCHGARMLLGLVPKRMSSFLVSSRGLVTCLGT